MAEVLAGVGPGAPTALAAGQRPDFQIIPLKGLPIVGAIILALIVGIASNTFWAITFFHVAAGALWTGIDLFVGLIIGPIIGSMPVPARIAFSSKFMPKMLLVMPTLVICTLAAGWQLARFTGNLFPTSPNHPWLVASYIVVGAMAVIALGILEPANLAVLFELKKPVPDGQLIGRLMKRFVYSAGITGVMQVATLVIMTRVATQ